MSQQTNLNVAPYFDDFNPDNDFHKVLFKPGYPVQARELTTLQSILQNQIERFGQHFFKEGAKVIPGNIGYNATYYAIQLQNSYLGIPVSAYAEQLVGAKITGRSSGVTAVVDSVLLPQDSERGNLTLYINYLSSSTQNNSTQQFSDGEVLTSNITITSGLLGNTTIAPNEPFAITLANNAAAVGASFNISEGVYFIRGNFVNVDTETLVLDQYTNTPNYRIGLYVDEQIITSDIDETLNDNSQGENNYAAPGADRLKISTFLFKKSLTDFDDNNFIELATVVDGVIRTKTEASNYNLVTDELARRTYAESGDYVVSSFDISVKESLNNDRGNRGIFNNGQFTYGGETPSEDLAVYQVSPGKAFVRGYEVDLLSSVFLDVQKPRTTKTLENQAVVYNTGPTLRINRVYGAPQVGLGNTFVLSLRNQRVGSASTIASGQEIGVARVYDFKLESGSYNSSNNDLNEWHISLFDIKTFTNITLNAPITLSVPTFVKGLNSGATGFIRNAVTGSTDLLLYDVKGSFIANESLSFDGNNSGVTGIAVTAYGLSDIKSVYGRVSAASTFNADVIQSVSKFVGIATVSSLKYYTNEQLFETDLSSTVGVGSTVVYLDTNQYTVNGIDYNPISIGNSITAGTGIVNASIVSVGNTYVIIDSNDADSTGTTLETQLSQTVGYGSSIIYIDDQIGVTVGSTITVGAAITNAQVVAIGDTFVRVGTAFTSAEPLRTTISSLVGIGTTTIFVGVVTGVVAGVSSISVGLALTDVQVVSIGDTFVNISTGSTVSYSIAAGTTATFTNVSSMITGTGVTFSRVSRLVEGGPVFISNPLFTSTVKSPNVVFPGDNLIFKNNLVEYSDTTLDDTVLARVFDVSSNSIEIAQVQTVTGITSSVLPTNTLEVTDFRINRTNLESSGDNTLYTPLPKSNISNVDINNSTLIIRKNFTVNISGNQLSANVSAGANETFTAFDVERYSLIRSDGTHERLTSDKFAFIAGGTELQIYNLGSNDTGATLTATLQKIKPKAKIKRKNRVNSILIDKSKYESSGIGATTANDGLTFGNYPYGTRVQDEIISLNVPDIIEIHGIFESADTSEPSPTKAVLASITSSSSTTDEMIIGEEIRGQSSGALAIVAEKLTPSQISLIYKNQNTFREGETITFSESSIQSQIVTLDSPSFDISFNYTFNDGQTGTYYDFGYLTRKSGSSEPNKKLKIYFSSGYYESTDDGDITTVNSYNTFDYNSEITRINDYRLSDILDIRPRVSDYTVTEDSRSPLEFFGRSFDSTGNSSTSILASDETITTSFSYYLGRIDRIYLTKDGKLQVKYGSPAEKPEKPVSVDDALEIATVTLPPYLYNTSQASIEFLEYKRYRMVDIKQLENRIKNLEYYTTLSLLETNTANLFVPDDDGLNRFKSGFFVDNFTSLLAQEDRVQIKNSIDTSNKELRPSHYTNSIDLIEGPVVGIDPRTDLAFEPIEGLNVRKTGDIVTLDYAEVEWLSQTFATRSESVTPFLISFWQGTVELTPATDTWVDTTRLEAKIINAEGNYAETLANAVKTLNVDPQTGFAPTVWNAWVTNWTGQDVVTSTSTRNEVSSRQINLTSWSNGWTDGRIDQIDTTTVIRDTFREVRDTGVETRTGTTTIVTEQFDRTSVGDRVVRRDLVPFMRSRNVQFVSKKLKPLTQIYAFFDGVDVTKYCVPKLLEITMLSGVFEVGETVTGYVQKTGLGQGSEDATPNITFRVAQTNHKEGPYDLPSSVFPQNPYNLQVLQSTYSSTSTVLNIDTFSLSNSVQGEFSGWVESGMILVGNSSQAQATISNVRLVSDLSATLIGSFYIPNPNLNVHPRFEAGTKTFTLVNDNTNDQNLATTVAEEGFTSSGTLETVQENIISVRNARIENKQEFDERAVARTTGTQLINSQVISSFTSQRTVARWYDPLAQSFLVDNETGVFLTSCDVFFRSKDDTDIPLTFQLRTMKGGFPTQFVIPFSEIILDPDQINTSADGSVATNIQFKSPVYLEGGKEYCICLASVSTKYSVYISRIGENDLLTQTFISNQPYLGSLFKSQNASTWESSQWEDLKFTLYRADFIESGTVEFYNPTLSEGNGQVAKLLPNALNFNSKLIRLDLSSQLNDSGLVFGNTIFQENTGAYGNYVGNAGVSTGTLSITNPGIGYTPSSGEFTFNNVSLATISGSGTGASANITISNGVAVAATISNGGNGYKLGDIVGISTIGATPVGRNARFSIVSIANTSQLIIDNVQGEFSVGSGNTIKYINSSGITTELNYSSGGNILADNIFTVSDGLHIKVNHKNHGMYGPNNYVTISNVQSDINPTKLSAVYASDSTGSITVDNATNFEIFEGVGVGTTNPGYLKIGNEIIEYTSVSGNTIGGIITRGTNPLTYPVGSQVYKYEVNGVSLSRINKVHNLDDVTIDNPVDFDYYHIKLDMSSGGTVRTGVGLTALYQNQTKSAGGYSIRASQNMPFEILTPIVQNLTVQGTSISAEVRTVTGTSISGNEIPFIDNGFENISINQPNYLDSTRLICSKINEENNLTNIVGNKSLNMRLRFDTTNTFLSPVIDTQRISTILTSNRVNSVITDYSTDSRVNSIFEDPTAFQYLSKEIVLENPATSIKVLLSAHINSYCDIRAFYSIGENPGFEPIFTPFPGYNNLNQRSQIISPENNDGRSDSFVTPAKFLNSATSNIDFKDYSFTIDQLPPFRGYRVKIVATSTNQVYVPRIKDLRVIALA